MDSLNSNVSGHKRRIIYPENIRGKYIIRSKSLFV